MILPKIYDKFNNIKNTSSRLAKESLLREYDSPAFRKVIKYLLNPYIVTNIGSAKLKKYKKLNDKSLVLSNFAQYIDFLMYKADGKQLTADRIMDYVNRQEEIYRPFLIELATKKFKMGLTSKTVNAIYGQGFIPEFNVMLAKKYEDEAHKIEGEFIITTKLNGCRMISVVNEGKIQLFSRQGKIMEDLVDLEKALSQLPNGVYDGEILAIGTFENSNEAYKVTINRSRIKGKKTGLKFVMYDYIELDEFQQGISTSTCIDRKNKLKEIIANNPSEYLEYLNPIYIGCDISKVMEICEALTNLGEEGCMLNIAKAPYQYKRTSDILKVKLFNEADVLVKEILEGEGKLKGMMGKVRVEFLYDGKIETCYCGSGFTDRDREYYWKNPNELLGKIITVSYKEVTTNDSGGKGLQFPVFKEVRLDKTSINDTNV